MTPPSCPERAPRDAQQRRGSPAARPGRSLLLVILVTTMVAALGISPGAANPPSPRASGLAEEIQALLDEHVGVTTPGAMVAIVGPDGPLLMEADGWADPLARTPLTLESRTPVASVSKVVTSLTALQLHHEGLLDLDADVRDHLPHQDRRAGPVRAPVTGRHLLTHHAGISEPLLVYPDSPGPEPTDLRGLLEENPPVLDRPGDVGLHYSPLQAYTMLGAMIEDATDASFDRAAAEWVLDPAGAESAGFDGAGAAPGDVALMGRAGQEWSATPWPPVLEKPAATLTWSTRDAAALLEALVSPDSPLPAEVVEEATTVAVRPAHGGGGHTQAFFEGWRADVPVLEHAGANGLAWLALVPDADIGVFAAVTTEDPEAAAFSDAVLETVADWTARTGQAQRDPRPADGLPTITPPWAAELEPADPAGTHQQQLFARQGPEMLLRTLTGQITITRDGEDILLEGRRLAPSTTPGRWCDHQGCLAAVESADGTVTVQRSDRAMLEQTLAPARWWGDQRFVLAAVAGAALLWILAAGGAARAWRRQRRRAAVTTAQPDPAGDPARAASPGQTVQPAPAVSRPLSLAWSSTSVLLVVATGWLLLSVLTAPTMGWIRAEGPAVWMLRLLTLAHLLLGAAWTVRALSSWGQLGRWRRVLVPPALLVGLAVSIVLVSWAVPSI